MEEELGSKLVEVLSRPHINTIVGCIYKHPNVVVVEFNNSYLQSLLDKLAIVKNYAILMGDFNVDLLRCETHSQSREF